MNSTVELATRLGEERLPGGWNLLRLKAADTARRLTPGLMPVIDGQARTVMASDAAGGTLSVILRDTESLAETPAITGLAGTAAPLPRGRVLLVGQERGLFALVHWLAALRRQPDTDLLVLLGTPGRFPFQPAPSRIYLPDMPPHVIATMPLLDDWHIPGRLAHVDGLPGCYEGEVLDFAASWLNQLTGEARGATHLVLAGAPSWCDSAHARLSPSAPASLTTQTLP